MLTVGLDIGTTTVKAALVASDPTRVLARGGQPSIISRPRPGWAEGDPEEWWRATRAALRQLGSRAAHADAVAVSGQGSTFCLCEPDGTPQDRAISWQDQRAIQIADEIERDLRPQLDVAHGNAIGDAPEPKLVWLARERPAFSEGVIALSAAATVSAALGAMPAITVGDAGSWLSYDRAAGAWSASISEALGLSAILPPIVAAGTIMGAVSATAAEATGLRVGIPIVATTSDVAAGAIAAGAGSPGEVFYSKGTGGFVCAHVEAVLHPGRLLALPVGRDGVVQLCAAIDTLGAAWDWCRALVGHVSLAEAERLARKAAPGSGGAIVLPWLQGAQHPMLELDARAVAAGLSLETGRGELLRAVLEGTAALLAAALATVATIVGEPPRAIVAAGGPTRNALWNQLDAAAVGIPVTVASEADAAVGSALLAGEAIGMWPDALEAGSGLRSTDEVVEPDAALARVAQISAGLAAELASVTMPLSRRLGSMRRQEGT